MPRAEYRLHRMRRHTGRQFECACGASFYTPKKLEDHRKEIHTGPWYRCGRCLTVFKTWKSFVRHTKTQKCKRTNPLYTDPDPEPESEADSAPVDHVETEHSRQRPLEQASATAEAEAAPS